MEKKITILVCILSVMYTYSQEGVEIPLNHNSNIHLESGTYVKDLNNLFNPYIGTWEGTWEGKKFTIKIEKVDKELHNFTSGYYYYRDRLYARYKVTELNNNIILESNLDYDSQDVKIKSLAYPKDNKFNFLYSDSNRCSNTGEIRLEGDPLSNQLLYKFFYEDFWISKDCPYLNQQDIPVTIPTVHVTLTKI